MPIDSWQTAAGVLRLSGQLVEGIQEGLARRGFLDVRPAQGFAFVRIAMAMPPPPTWRCTSR
ncbi:hypothetical protein [Aeromicrobium sp.]|uniref:hypothetical protein n=1 Tax=Aeromicrobium sp. TaxID=1871063 RepID=UPI0030C598B6